MPQKNLIIVPCYNEADRLNMAAFEQYAGDNYFLFVNDGSKDKTVEVIQQYASEYIMLLDLEQNGGKAEAVRQGFIYAGKLPFVNDLAWVGFWDADLATPLYEIDNFVKYQQLFAPKAEIVMGSRVKRKGSNIVRATKRHILGRFFATVIDNVFHTGCYDTQCGAKLFRPQHIETISSEPYISKWAFDVELLIKLKDVPAVEYPLQEWEDVAGSKLNVTKIAPQILKDIFKMRRKYMR